MKILIFRIGQLGDTLVAIPALRVIRNTYPDAYITLLCDIIINKNYILAADILSGTKLIDDYIAYQSKTKSILKNIINKIKLLIRIKENKYDILIYLPPSGRTQKQILRDKCYFRLCGIPIIHGMNMKEYNRLSTHPISVLPFETDVLLENLKCSGYTIPQEGQRKIDLSLCEDDYKTVDIWLKDQKDCSNKKWIAVGPRSKMQAKLWPIDRYETVLKQLIKDYDIWPVIFGGNEDKHIGESIINKLKRGYVAAGALKIRASAAALSRCLFYLGNDTGTMHLAVAVGIKCVAIFSSRDYPGRWYPYGTGHIVLRSNIECEGCMLEECVKNKKECLMQIDPDTVYQACVEMIKSLK